MSVEYNQSILESINSPHQQVNDIAARAWQYSQMTKAGDISPSEYSELLLDLQRQANIQENMSDLENMEKLNTAINSLVQIARLV